MESKDIVMRSMSLKVTALFGCCKKGIYVEDRTVLCHYMDKPIAVPSHMVVTTVQHHREAYVPSSTCQG